MEHKAHEGLKEKIIPQLSELQENSIRLCRQQQVSVLKHKQTQHVSRIQSNNTVGVNSEGKGHRDTEKETESVSSEEISAKKKNMWVQD